MSPRKRKFVILGAAFCLLLAGGLVLALSRPAPEQPDFLRNMPEPNGYVLYVKAAEALVGDPEAVTNDVSSFLEQNREALVLWQEAAGVEAEAPPEYYPPFEQGLGPRNPQLSGFRSLAKTAQILGEQAEAENRPEDAVEIYCDLIRMGQAIEHGYCIHMMVGIAIEQMGLEKLRRAAKNLQPEERLKLAAELETLNDARILSRR